MSEELSPEQIAEPRTWYLLWCLECAPPDDLGNARIGCEMPFPSAEDRGRWAGQHTRGTGHDQWHVIDLPEGETLGPHHLQRGWPSSPALAAAKELLQELETLRGIAKRLADGWLPARRTDGTDLWVERRFAGGSQPMTPAERAAIYGEEGESDDVRPR